MRNAVFIFGVIAGIGSGAAQAADLPRAPVTKAAVAAPMPTWTGWYSGLHGGWGWGDVDHTYGTGDPLFAFGMPSTKIDGGVFGGQIGYNWQVAPNWLFGFEASLAWSGIDGTTVSSVNPLGSISNEIEWLTTFTPRLGWTSNNWLFYVKGGLAGARVETVASHPLQITYTANHDFWGWTAGAGIEMMWSPNWIFGVEYNYYDLGDRNLNGTYFGNGITGTAVQTADVKFSSLLARLSYRY